jgi:protein-L-isoaspartate O-methyltransferase
MPSRMRLTQIARRRYFSRRPKQIQASGVTTLNGIAAALAARSVPTATFSIATSISEQSGLYLQQLILETGVRESLEVGLAFGISARLSRSLVYVWQSCFNWWMSQWLQTVFASFNRVDDEILRDFAEFSGEPLKDIVERIANIKRTDAAEWQTFKQIGNNPAAFYEGSQHYIYDTLSANFSTEMVEAKLDSFNPRILASIRNHPGKRFLEFGAGVGTMCEIAARMGKDVTYLELRGIVFDFARWRFEKHRLPVKMIEAETNTINLPGLHDIIFTDAVLEHLPPELQILATEKIAQGTDDGGLLIFLVDLSGPTKDNPMHFNVDIERLHCMLSHAGLKCEDGRSTFCSIWRRK